MVHIELEDGAAPEANRVEAEAKRIFDDYVSEDAMAEELGLSLRTLRDWRQRRIGPPWLKIQSIIFYSVSGSRKWAKAEEKQPLRNRKGAA